MNKTGLIFIFVLFDWAFLGLAISSAFLHILVSLLIFPLYLISLAISVADIILEFVQIYLEIPNQLDIAEIIIRELNSAVNISADIFVTMIMMIFVLRIFLPIIKLVKKIET